MAQSRNSGTAVSARPLAEMKEQTVRFEILRTPSDQILYGFAGHLVGKAITDWVHANDVRCWRCNV